MDKSTLHQAIKNTAEGYIEKHKTRTVSVSKFVSDNGVITEDDPVREKVMRDGVDGVKDLIDIIAEAVAQEVIAHIQEKLQLTGGSATFIGQTAAGKWTGAGGGVPGPVTIVAGTGMSGSETLNIAPGTFK